MLILDDRFGRSAAIAASQLPVSDWHRQLNEPTLDEAILDRLVHGAIRFELRGASLRAHRAEAGERTFAEIDLDRTWHGRTDCRIQRDSVASLRVATLDEIRVLHW
ncbi:MAG: ATP-binding protein [Albidovulum sp.]|nr:ATP-binding protein [Albidovulum sp.]